MRHILIVAVGALLLFSSSALVFNTWAIFVVPVSSELGVPTSSFTLNVTVIFLTCAAVASPMGSLMERVDLRIMLSFSVCCCGLGLLLCSQWQEIWQFYISGVLEGIGAAIITNLAAPTLIVRWFKAHTGLLLGFCVAMAGVGGALWSMVGGLIIASMGWRVAYLSFGTLALGIGLPATIFFVRSYPYEVGLVPYSAGKPERIAVASTKKRSADSSSQAEGSTGNEAPADSAKRNDAIRGVSAKRAFTMPAFLMLAVTFMLFNGTAQSGQLLPTYIYHLSDEGLIALSASAAVIMASAIAMCMQIGQASGKICLGIIADRNVVIALCASCACGAMGILICWQLYEFTALLYVGGLLMGFLYAATNVLAPTLTRKYFGDKEYTRIYARIATCINITPAIGAFAFAALAEIGWDLFFSVVLGIVVVIFVCSVVTVRLGSRVKFDDELDE